jgi:hypothetical protein
MDEVYRRRLADWHFERAQTWEDLLASHEKWLLDFNYQHHYAHEQRQDGCHSPAANPNEHGFRAVTS